MREHFYAVFSSIFAGVGSVFRYLIRNTSFPFLAVNEIVNVPCWSHATTNDRRIGCLLPGCNKLECSQHTARADPVARL